jgi:hypothetical protein
MRRAARIVVVGLAALLIGRLTAPGSDSPPTPHPDPPGPTSSKSGGVGADYAHSRAGAIAASAGYQQAFADTAVLRPDELRERIEAVATPGYAPQLLAANRPGARHLAHGALGAGLRAKIPTAYFGVPVFYRLDSYTPSRAVIRSWGFTVVGNASTAEPGAYFGTSRVVLVWKEERWRIAATRAAFGPTPRLVSPRRGGEGFELVDLIEGMRPYASAP